MATILNADTSTGGLIATGDSSGDLELQADGTTKVAVTSSGVSINGIAYPTSDGSANQVLQTNGSGTLSFATGGGGFQSMQVFTSSGTWTKPSGITKVKVTVVGGWRRIGMG